MKALSDLPLGGRGRLLSIDAVCSTSQRLLAMGFLPGLEVKVVAVAPFGDPITVELQGHRLSLRRADAVAVKVGRVGG
ncbi:MAG TPA: ferrous iron transport protein A [Verrucomicrobiae bacterium]|nr:ferrous iron transport protein A [Verrucomicrobiae bacterium]